MMKKVSQHVVREFRYLREGMEFISQFLTELAEAYPRAQDGATGRTHRVHAAAQR